MHPRNRHQARYDFAALTRACPELSEHVRPNPSGEPTIDFADPLAVERLNRALLQVHYGIADWTIPPGYLCPAIPGRADYVHAAADLLASDTDRPPGADPNVVVLDVGTGASAIYPLLGAREYGWRFVATEIDPVALESAQRNVAVTPDLAERIECRRQPSPGAIFRDVVRPGEHFDLVLCNPPFHRSAAEAAAGTNRKLRNLGTGRTGSSPALNFGGRGHELWCPGGEAAFLRRLITESIRLSDTCRWFTSLVSRRENLPAIERALGAARAVDVRQIELAQGQKQSRFVAWTFLSASERRTWLTRARG
jgi:23S rRNA (adenine1618-N6)-methyltransferase